jgi:membrane-bound serine protease (ClpP class)
MYMKRGIFLILPLAFALVSISFSHSAVRNNKVLVIRVNGVINPVSAEFIDRSLAEANEERDDALVIELDTPGGLDTSMRSIVKGIIGSSTPVIVYIAPSGARAASAGVFITLAADVAAMAPGTNIGAAHPVTMGGGELSKTMEKKVVNDAAAYIRSLAERNGRNAEWAEDSVRKSVSVAAEEALKEHVVDIVRPDLNSLLKSVDGWKVRTGQGEITLKTAKAVIVRKEMGWRYKILDFISDPSVAYILMLLGFYGLFFEFTNPGTIFPGVTGAIFLILAFYSFQTLPVNYAGLLLIILGLVLFILEIKIVSHGILTIGGIISMVLGSLMLFESPAPFFRLSLYLILPAVVFTALFFTVTFSLAYRAFRRKPITGREGIIGMEGVAKTDITRDGGMVLVQGELWSGYSDDFIPKGGGIVVQSVADLKLKVTKSKGG